MIFLVTRTDEDDLSYDCEKVVVRAASGEDALRMVCLPDRDQWMKPPSWDPDKPPEYHRYDGFKADGSNAKVTRIEEDGEEAYLCAYYAGTP